MRLVSSSQPETDVLSSVLRAIRLDAAFYFNVEFSAPWMVEAPGSDEVGPMLAPKSEHLIIYHFVIGGNAYASLGDDVHVPLAPGDIVMFPHGDGHVLGSGSETHMVDAEDVFKHWKRHGLEVAHFGGGGGVTKLVCGYFVCEPRLSSVVLAGLPRLLRVNIRGDSTGQWLEDSIRFSVTQGNSIGVGGQAVLAKLSEALFVETVRRYLQDAPSEESGWLAGVRDPDVGRALALLHAEPRRSWTIKDLASEVGVSRSVLAERFTRFMGEPPMSYLTRWRLQLGAQMLASTSRGIADIAADVSYESEASFNRAFKRVFDMPPARYRKKVRNDESVAPTER